MIYTEPGGRMEAELARWVTDNNSRLPIVAFMAGRFMDEMPGMSFGHAGTIVEGKEDTATEKIARLADAGIVVAEEISRDPGHRQGPDRGDGVSEALFIDVEVDASVAHDRELAAKLAEVCPVDIFRAGDDGVEIVEDNLDECVLCELCLNAAPRRRRSGDQALRRRRTARGLKPPARRRAWSDGGEPSASAAGTTRPDASRYHAGVRHRRTAERRRRAGAS